MLSLVGAGKPIGDDKSVVLKIGVSNDPTRRGGLNSGIPPAALGRGGRWCLFLEPMMIRLPRCWWNRHLRIQAGKLESLGNGIFWGELDGFNAAFPPSWLMRF
jgi:hypothetical protein